MNKLNQIFKLIAFLLILMFTHQKLLAHHSAIAFDKTKSVTVTGKITRSVWRNPHMAINIDVADKDGNDILWKIEGPGTTILAGKGFNKKMLLDATKSKESIIVTMHPLRSGKPGGLLQRITLANGESYQVGEEYQDPAAGEQERIIPSLVEWTPPPAGETWQEREAKTRPKILPLIASDARQTSMGALDPENLNKEREPAPFDITGIWSFRGEDRGEQNFTSTYGSYEFKPHPTFTKKGQATLDEYKSYARAGKRYYEPTARCYPAGMPRIMTRYGALMMLQYPTAIYMVSRLNNEYRVIWLDGREREPEASRDNNWNGESLGHWDGDTLVVETSGFTDDNHLIQQGIFTGDQLKIIERISMLNDGNTLKIDFTMTDPEHWEGEWKHTKFRDLTLRADIREANCFAADNELLPGM
ncbi:MAG: DUF6152 family protein [Woeseiaceae bacterium]|nr:DUF6152 family protein [Woeseiaceae bacterium]